MRPVDYCIEYRQELLTACLVILLRTSAPWTQASLMRRCRRGDRSNTGPNASGQRWCGRTPDGADPKKTSDEVHDQAHPEQKEAAAFFAAWHETFGSREVRTSDVHEVCRREEDSALAAAVADLDIAPPKVGPWSTRGASAHG